MLGFDDISKMWEAHANKLLLILRPHGSWAEDAVQEAFLALAQQEQIPDTPLAWLVTVARNSILQGQRAEHRRTLRQLEREHNRDWFSPSEAEATVDALETTEALRTLPKVQLEIVLLRVWGELSFDEIATVMNSSRSTVHRHYQQAIDELRGKFTPPKNDQENRNAIKQ